MMEGLEEGILPARALETVRGGLKEVFTEETVQDKLRGFAITILMHEQIMMHERGKVSESSCSFHKRSY